MAKRYLAKRRTSEDATGLAGWLFTDLLLGLVMIFISAVAFVAYRPIAIGPDGTVIQQECKDYVAAFIQEPLVIQYKEGEGSDIGARVDTYINTEQTINGIKHCEGSGKSKKQAEQIAAFLTLQKFKEL